MELTRQYKNAAGEDLRVDVITMERKGNTIASKAQTHTFKRNLVKRTIVNNKVTDRVVDEIEIIGDYDSIENASGNYTWAEWDSPAAKLDMSDLPKLSETV